MSSILSKVFARSVPGANISGARRSWFYRSGVTVNEDGAMQVAAFNRGLIYISTQIAKLPWDVKDRDNAIQYGTISNLLNLAPNEEMNAFFFRLVMIQQAIIHGNAYAEIERDLRGFPIALWPLPSNDVDPVRDPGNNKLYYRVRNSSTSQPGGDVFLEPRDIFHVKNFHTKDGLVGQGLVSYAREVLGMSIAADRMASGIFVNGGVPSGVLSHPGRLSDEAYKRLKDSWRAEEGGSNSGGTKILEEGLTYTTINIDPETLQFLQSRQFSVLEIARFFGIPPTKLFDIAAATYSNVENANLEVATDTLDAWCRNLESEADVKLLTNSFGGRFTELDLTAVFRGDMKSRSDYAKTMMGIGAMTPNEARRREGMAPYKEGDEFYIATNNFTPVSRMDEVIDAQIKSKEPAPKPAPDSEDDSQKKLAAAAIEFLSNK